MDLIWSDGFKRSFKKLIKKNPQLKPQIFDVLRKLAEDPFTLSLKTHKLSGNLEGLWSCTVAYDCRIIFSFSEDGEYLGLAERICNLYRKRLLAELRVAQVQGNLLKSLKTLAPSLASTNVPQSRATPNLTRKLRVSLGGEIIPRQSLGYHGQSNSLVRI